MAKEPKKPAKSMLLRLWRPKLFEAIKKEADKNRRAVNSEVELALEEKYL
jgi:hypothetical protein